MLMFTAPEGSVPTEQIIRDAINYNEAFRYSMTNLDNYYLGKHPILYREKFAGLANNRVVVNHAQLITETNVGHLIGNPVDYRAINEANIEPLIDAYKAQGMSLLDTEIARATSKFGLSYELVYADGNDPRSAKIDPRNCVLVVDNSVQRRELFAVVYEVSYGLQNEAMEQNMLHTGLKPFKYVKVMTIDANEQITWANYKVGGKLLAPTTPEPHSFGMVPVIQYNNNESMLGDYEVVLTLIDVYNVLQSDRVNDKEQLVDAILALYGFGIETEAVKQLKKDRILSNLPKDGKAEYIVKQLNEEQLDILRRNLQDDIQRISQTPDMTDEKFGGASASGVALQYKFWPFAQHTKGKERYFEKGLIKRFKLYNNYLAKLGKMDAVSLADVELEFNHSLPQNDLETAQMIALLQDKLPLEPLIAQLSFVDDASTMIEQKKLEDKQNAINTNPTNFGTPTPAGEMQPNAQMQPNQMNNGQPTQMQMPANQAPKA